MQKRVGLSIIGTFCAFLTLLLAACGESPTSNPPSVNPVSVPTTLAATTAAGSTIVATTAATTAPATMVVATAAATTVAVTTARPTTVAATTAGAATTSRATTAAAATTATRPTTAAATTVVATSPARVTTRSTGDAQAIRKTNWLEILNAEPNLEKSQELFANGKTQLYVTTKDGKKTSGFPALEPITYVDMDGDGLEDAALILYSGGTAGNIGFLAYRQTATGPVYAGAASGYKLNLEILQNKLVANNMLYAFWEPNCCPGGFSSTTYVIKNGALAVIAETTAGFPTARIAAVQQFYNFIDQKSFKEAYSMLGNSYQAANPYDKWTAGFANTTKVEVEANEDPSGAIRINLTSTDNVAGKSVTKKYTGTWKLVWDASFTGWRLTEPSISEAK